MATTEQQYTDPETGLLYLRSRYYDPTTAQFLTRDPMDAMTRSTYGYGDNDPLDMDDPSGLGFGWHSITHVAHDVVAAPGHVAHDIYEHRKGLSQGLAYAATGLAIGACIAFSVGVCAVAVAGGVAARGFARAQDVGFGHSWRADAADAGISGAFLGVGWTPEWAGSFEGLGTSYGLLGRVSMAGPDIGIFAADLATGGDLFGDRFDDKSCR